ncbi:MAG: lipase family protein [Gordonia sp. (in: high G+C Gram-positive bacteria)]|uniref:lipase family protein n=1 Tax=Gordonia sp. (in: high G+C Gram-positive bacteria) TaxID=84139 RepID=UPI0039E5E94B
MTRTARIGLALAACLTVLAALVAPRAAAVPQTGAGSVVSFSEIDDPNYAIPGAGDVYAIHYLSRGVGDALVPVRATAWIPTSPAPATGYPVASWAHGTRGLGDACAIHSSVFVKDGPDYASTLKPFPQKGFVLVASEYAGIDGPGLHPYLDGRVSGANVIDAVRAVREVGRQIGVNIDKRYTTAGGSQGGHASLSAGTMAASYAPELELLGTTAVAPPVYIDRYLSQLGPDVPALPVPDYVTYLSYVLGGLKAADPSLDVDGYLTPVGRATLKSAETLCYQDMVKKTRGMGVGEMLSRPLDQGPLMAAVRNYQVVPVRGYRSPVLIHQGEADLTAFAPLTDQYVDDARAAGATIDYRKNLAGHDTGRQPLIEAADWAYGKWKASVK